MEIRSFVHRGLCTREGDLLWMRACPTLRRNQMLLTMQQICLLRGIGSLLSLWCHGVGILLFHLCGGDICSLAGEKLCVFVWYTMWISLVAWPHCASVEEFQTCCNPFVSLDLKNKRLG